MAGVQVVHRVRGHRRGRHRDGHAAAVRLRLHGPAPDPAPARPPLQLHVLPGVLSAARMHATPMSQSTLL